MANPLDVKAMPRLLLEQKRLLERVVDSWFDDLRSPDDLWSETENALKLRVVHEVLETRFPVHGPDKPSDRNEWRD